MAAQRFQFGLVRRGDIDRRNSGNFSHDLFNIRRVNLLPVGGAAEPDGGTGFIDDIDGLVGKESIVDEFSRQLTGRFQGRIRVFNPMVRLVTGAQPLEDLDGFFNRWFQNIYLFKSSGQGPVLFEMIFIFLIGRGPDAAQFAGRQKRF